MHILFQKDVLSNIFELKRENDTKSTNALLSEGRAAAADMHLTLKGWNRTSVASEKRLDTHLISCQRLKL